MEYDRSMRRLLGASLLLMAVVATAAAQVRGTPASVGSIGSGRSAFTPGVGASVTSLGPAGFVSGRITPAPEIARDRVPRFLTPVFFPWYTAYAPAPQPVVVIVEPPAPVIVLPERGDDRPPELVILEREGDRYVRRNYSRIEPEEEVGEEEEPAACRDRRDSDRTARKKPAPRPELRQERLRDADERPLELEPAVLVFLDGTRSEVENFVIVGDLLYDLSDRRARKIRLAELDLPATIAANDERGIAFRLPPASNPDQVITRP